MKRLFTSIMLLVSILMLSHGMQNATTRYFDVECEEQWQTNTILIEDDNTIIYSISLLNELGIYKKWASSGNVVIIDSTATSARFYSNGPLKGRIYYYFDDDPAKPCQCGLGSVSLDVYKHFDAAAKYGVEIIGPDCIADGDSVVFSINPILTGNLYSGVGMDLYNWNIFDATSAPYVQSIPYVSGDSSSVTFKVGTMTGNDSITVRVGMANEEYRIVKYLGKAAPKPVFLSSTCVPYGKAPITFEVEQVEGVKYHWASSDNNWRFATRTQSGNIVTVTPNENTSPFITITATYTNGDGCNGSSTSVEMHRTWGSSIILQKEGDVYNRCVADTTLFILDGQVAGSGVHWDLPKGWDFINDDTNGFSISIKPINPDSVLLKDTIVAVSKDTCDRIYRKSSWIYVKPASVTDITDYGCLKTDTIYKFKITGWGHAPKAEYYKWIVGNDTTIGGDSLEWRTIAGTQEIKVIPRGAMYDETNYYWGDTATFTLTFRPTPPNAIACPDCECVSVNMPDTLKFYVSNAISNQTYSWTYTHGLTLHRQNNDTIELITNGTPNAKDTVWVKAVQDNPNCPQSDSIYKAISIGTIDESFYVRYKPRHHGKSELLDENDDDENVRADYKWYLLYNQKEVLYAYNFPTQESPYLLDNTLLISKLGQTTLPSNYIIMVEFTPFGSCNKMRLFYPENILPSNFTPIDTISISRLPDLPQNMAPRREKTTDIKTGTLQLYPNPTEHTLHLSLQDKSCFDIRIVTMDGKPVYIANDNLQQYDVNVSSFSQGRYLVTAFKDGRRIDSKIFIKK